MTRLLLILALLPSIAHAQENHDHHHSYYKNWVNKADRGCCDNRDCGEIAPKNERITGGRVEIRIYGEWCPVLPHHYLKSGNAPDWSVSHACVLQTYNGPAGNCARLRCYQPKPGA